MSANFTPSQSAIKDLKPFRFWCQKVLPTVYDDSLSYYELLTKVVNYLNDTIDNVEALNDNVQNIYDAYILLQNYVNEYFDNTLPQLVSDKLDEMAEDGTLTALISGYIDPLFEAKTDEIDGIIEHQNTTISNAITQQNNTISNAITEQNNTISEAIEEQDSDISLLQTRMNNFINNHAGLIGEETIWEGSTPFVTENTSITLDNPVSDYVFIDIYYNHRGKRAVQRFQKSDVLDATGFYVRDTETGRPPGGTPQEYPYFRTLQFKLVHSTNNGSVLTLAESSESIWDGSFTVNPAVSINPATSGITKVVGVNMVQSDSEVADARVSEDGTVYPNLESRLNTEFGALKSAIEQGGGGMTVEFKQALETLLANVVYKGNDPTGRTYLTALHNAMYPPTNLVSISAVYTQSGTVYDTDTLDSLKADLVVTAHYDDLSTETVTNYVLSGTLTEGTSVITVSYGGKTTTFNVMVSTLSYITNGLVHRWDGIDNTSSGHDSSVTVWEDLVGSNDLTMNSSTYATWTSNALNLAGNNAQYLDCVGGQIDAGEATVEVVISPQTSATAQLIVFFGTNQRSACYYSDKTFSMNGASSNAYPIGVSEFSEVHHLAGAYNSGVATGTYYLNGEEATQGSTTHSLTGNQTGIMRVGTTGSNVPGYPFTGLIHSIRIYNRLLSASEIAQNYAVDVARFGFGE